jgi:hypothetical protein
VTELAERRAIDDRPSDGDMNEIEARVRRHEPLSMDEQVDLYLSNNAYALAAEDDADKIAKLKQELAAAKEALAAAAADDDKFSIAWFFDRAADDDNPAGVTVSKKDMLPDGDFGITEYCWGDVSLWFVDHDRFTPDERQAAYQAWWQRADNVHGTGAEAEGADDDG